MRAELVIDKTAKEPFARIYTDVISNDVRQALLFFDKKDNVITALNNEKIIILQPQEIFMIRIENEKTVIYCENEHYYSEKRLYWLSERLGGDFMQISKSVLINLKQIKCVEPSFKGMMKLFLKNGSSDYISRHYLPEFKNYLGL